MTVLHDLYAVLWGATWGNNTAALEWAAAASLVAWLGRHRIGRLRARLAERHPHNAALAEIRQIAEAARRIAADTYERHAGERHPDSPERKDTQ